MGNDAFSVLLQLLHRHEVRFIVVGGVACALNGFVRATEDVDILVDVAPDNIARMLTALRTWGEGHAVELKADEFTLEPGCIQLVEEFPLNIFTLIAGRRYEDFAPRAGRTADGLLYLSALDLVAVKSGTRREKDTIDVLALKRILSERQKGFKL
jgi:hypothetical protein